MMYGYWAVWYWSSVSFSERCMWANFPSYSQNFEHFFSSKVQVLFKLKYFYILFLLFFSDVTPGGIKQRIMNLTNARKWTVLILGTSEIVGSRDIKTCFYFKMGSIYPMGLFELSGWSGSRWREAPKYQAARSAIPYFLRYVSDFPDKKVFFFYLGAQATHLRYPNELKK